MKALFIIAFLPLACGAPQGVEPAPAPDAAATATTPGVPTPVGCGLSTEWAGDEACLPDNGAQIHFGPADYDDPIGVAPFLSEPGTDATYTVDAPPTLRKFMGGYTAATRPGNHHLSLLARMSGTPDYNYRPYTTTLPGKTFLSVKKDGTPVSFSTPPEYVGAAIELPGGAVSWVIDAHFINASGETRLMEGWINLDIVTDPPVILSYFQFSGGTSMNVPAGARAVVATGGAACAPPQDVKIVRLGSHSHVHNKRVSVFVGGELIYTNLDWEHPFPGLFSSGATNAPPTLTTEGARSGVLSVPRGTAITWECAIQNNLTTPIRYGANLQTAEMCALSGFYTPPLPNHAAWGCAQP